MFRLSSAPGSARFCLALGLGVCMLATCQSAVAQQRLTQPKRATPPETKKAAADVARSLDGAWRLVKALDPTGQLRELPPGIEMTKLVVGGRFAWVVAQHGRALAGGGGTYSQTPTTYTETYSYAVGQNQQGLVGSTTRFTWRLEGDKWYHKGTIRVGQQQQQIDEVWERVP
jgi:hypothetical protein